VGGKILANALSLLATGGTCLTLGWLASPEVTIDVRELIHIGRTTLYGLMEELNHRGASEDLAWLAQMIAKQQLKTSIEVETSWHEIGDVAQRLLQRQLTGKAVLHLNR
jgi:NADPH:quinone reductase